jgi:type I restriction enzyme S subunit
MGDWKECKLGEVAEIVGGGTPKTKESEYWNGEIAWLTPRDLSNFNGRYISKGERNISKLGLAKSSAKILPKGVVLLSSRAPVGYLAIAKNEVSTNQGFRNLISNSETNNLFLFYLLKNNVEYLKSQSTGTTFGELAGSTLKSLSFYFPPLTEQKAIASVLSSLDDKIDLLHRQNKTLEAMAETLFRQWFVEKAKEDWEDGSLLEVIQLVGGGTPKTSIVEYWDGDIPWLAGGDITSNHKSFVKYAEKNITEAALNNSATKLLPKYATIISARGTVGKYCLLAQPMAFSQSNYGILPKNSDCYFFTYLLINHVVEELQASAYGSVFDTITTTTFRENKVQLPPETEILQFDNSVSVYFEKMFLNKSQIQTFEKLRDTLLPKLMSGEVRVEYDAN